MGWGEVFSLGCAMTWALAVIMFRASGQGLPAFELNLFKNAVALVFLLPTAIVMAGWQPPPYSAMEWGIVLISGYLGIAVADTWYLRALQILGAGRTGVVASLYSPFVMILSMLFLGERLTLWQYPGFVLILGGILLVTWRHAKDEITSAELIRGFGFGAGGVLLMAIGIVMVKEVLENYEFFWTVVLRLAGGIGGMLLLLTWRRRWPRTIAAFNRPQPWMRLIIASFLGTYISMLMWLAGYRLTLATIAAILNETAATFIVIFAWLFLKEPLNPRKIGGIVLALSGVVILIGL